MDQASTRSAPNVPAWLVTGAEWGWRLAVLGVVSWALIRILAQMPVLVVSLLAAALLTALLSPAIRVGRRYRIPTGVTAVVGMLGFLGAAAGSLAIVIRTVAGGLTGASPRLSEGWNRLLEWLQSGPLHGDGHDVFLSVPSTTARKDRQHDEQGRIRRWTETMDRSVHRGGRGDHGRRVHC